MVDQCVDAVSCPKIGLVNLPSGVVGQPYSGTLTSTATSFTTDSTVFSIDNSGNVTGNPTQAGTYNLVVMLDDRDLCECTFVITVDDEQDSDCPDIIGTNLPQGIVNQPYSGSITSDSTTYSINSTVFSVDNNGNITGTPTSPGSYPITLTLDGTNCTFSTIIIVVQENQEACPEIVSTSFPSGIEGQSYTGSINSTATSYSINSTVFSIDASGNVTGTPTSSGSYPIDITYGDGCVYSTVIEVSEVAEACCPHIDLIDLQYGIVNQPYSGQVEASDADSYSLTMSGFIISQSGIITGQTSAIGSQVGVLEITKDGRTCQSTVIIPFIEDSNNSTGCCASISSIRLSNAIVGQPYSGSVLSNADSYALSLTGFSIDNSGTISGTPTNVGQVDGQLTTVLDGVECTTAISIDVEPIKCPDIDLISLPTATVGESYSGAITSAADAYSFTGTEFSIDNNGNIMGVPTSQGVQTGTLTMTQNGESCETTLSILVNAADEFCCPKVHSVYAPTAFIGESYAGFFTADGVNNTYAMTNGPVGMTIDSTNGDITGVPVEEENPIAVITVTNDDGTCDYNLNFVVTQRDSDVNLPPALVTVGKLCGVAGECMITTFQATDPEGMNVTYTMSPDIPGMTFSDNGILQGEPEQAGNYQVTISYTDGETSYSTVFTICIAEPHPDCVKAYIRALNDDSSLTCEGYFCNCKNDAYEKWLSCGNTGSEQEFLDTICSQSDEYCMRVVTNDHEIDGYKPMNASICNPVKIRTSKATYDLFVQNGWALAGCDEEGIC